MEKHHDNLSYSLAWKTIKSNLFSLMFFGVSRVGKRRLPHRGVLPYISFKVCAAPKGTVFKTPFKSEIGIDFVNFGVKMGTFSGLWSGIIILIS